MGDLTFKCYLITILSTYTWYVCACQGTALWSQFSPSPFMWTMGIKLGAPGFAQKVPLPTEPSLRPKALLFKVYIVTLKQGLKRHGGGVDYKDMGCAGGLIAHRLVLISSADTKTTKQTVHNNARERYFVSYQPGCLTQLFTIAVFKISHLQPWEWEIQ